ncbi:MAG: 2OG-Fe(II) oxygenase, partial [Paracoccaceae bacterium]
MIAVHAIEGAFSARDCARIVALAKTVPATEARLVGAQRAHNIRRAELSWLDEAEGGDWVMERIMDLVREANRDVFGFDLTDFAESPQVAIYDGRRAGHFDWHADIGDGPLARRRKLTLVVQLSDPADYAGGRLEIMPGTQVRAADRAQGSATLFPAFLLHRVTPVTKGLRRS